MLPCLLPCGEQGVLECVSVLHKMLGVHPLGEGGVRFLMYSETEEGSLVLILR